MSELKSNILAALYRDAGAAVSGGILTGRFGVSRTAVWKAVNELCAEGYQIERINRGGYRFTGDGGVLSAEIIETHLETESLGRELEILPETDSTVYYVKRALPKNAGYTVLSDRQSAGHGRFDRAFHSLCFSSGRQERHRASDRLRNAGHGRLLSSCPKLRQSRRDQHPLVSVL